MGSITGKNTTITYPDSVNYDTNFNVVITCTNSKVHYNVTATLGSQNYPIRSTSMSGASVTIPMNVASEQWITIDSTYRTMKIKVETILDDGNITIDTVSCSFKITVPSTVKPVVSRIIVSDPTGNATKYGGYVVSKSKLDIKATVLLGMYSPIDTYSVKANGSTYTVANPVTSVITGASNSITYAVTDKRGRKGSASTTFTMLDYENPKIQELTAYRCNADGTDNPSGTYFKLIYDGSISPLNNVNSKAFLLEYKEKDATAWTTIRSGTDYLFSGEVVLQADENKSYNVRMIATDDFATTTAMLTVSSSYTLIDFNASGKGIAFGKASEADEFDVNMDAKFRKNVTAYGSAGVCVRDATNNKKSANIYTYVEGTTSTEGIGALELGNATAKGTAGNSTGTMYIYGDTTKYATVKPASGMTSNPTITLPKTTGTLALEESISSSTVSLTFNGGTTHTANLRKKNGYVQFTINAAGGSTAPTSATAYTLGTLPSGYRPVENIFVPCVFRTSRTMRGMGMLQITTAGAVSIYAHNCTTASAYINANISFYAG